MSLEQTNCPFCARAIEKADDFCPWCGKPLTTFATTDPVQVIRAEGEMIRGSMVRPTPIVLVGMWLLFGLPLLFFMVVPFLMLFDANSGIIDKIIGFSACGFFAWLYFAIVRKVTGRYWAARKKEKEPGSKPGQD